MFFLTLYNLGFRNMKEFCFSAFFFIFSILGFPVYAQHVHNESHDYHIGFGISETKFLGEDGLKPGLHLHFLKSISAEGRWGVGVGFEGVKSGKWHNGFNLLLNYRPVEFLSFNLGPGIVIEKVDRKNEVKPTVHLESVLEYDVSKIHLGPMVGFGIDKEHTHFSFGIHIGFGI